jgi:hypothetical protein
VNNNFLDLIIGMYMNNSEFIHILTRGLLERFRSKVDGQGERHRTWDGKSGFHVRFESCRASAIGIALDPHPGASPSTLGYAQAASVLYTESSFFL